MRAGLEQTVRLKNHTGASVWKNRLPLLVSPAPPPRYGSRGPAQSYRCISPSVPSHPDRQQTLSQCTGCLLMAPLVPVLRSGSIHASAGQNARGLIPPLWAAVPPQTLCLLRHFPGCCRQLSQANQAVWLQARACVCVCALPPLRERVRMCNKTACTSVENMCVSEGVSKSERLSGNIHACTSMLARWGGFL